MQKPKHAIGRTLLGLTAAISLTAQTLDTPVLAQEKSDLGTVQSPSIIPGGAEVGLFDAAPPSEPVLGAAGGVGLPEAQTQPVFEKKVIRDVDPSGQRCVRIPAIVTAEDGSLLVAFDNRRGSGTNCPDAPFKVGNSKDPSLQTDIELYRSTDSGKNFEKAGFIAQGTRDPRGLSYTDPAMVVDRTTGKIFAFFVRALDQRVAQAGAGYHEGDAAGQINNRSVQDTIVIESNDDGQTWENMRLISHLTGQVKVNGRTYQGRGRFVTSGSGIQLRYGEHAGRLIVPIAVDVEPSWSAKFVNLAIYSDNGGETWEIGEGIAGDGARSGDENKLVELSDGTLMMNSKEFGGSTRWTAYSTDQGLTWGNLKSTVFAPPQHPSKFNEAINVGLIRAYPNAPQGSAAAKVLLHSAPIEHRTSSDDGRRNGWVMASCDDGKTWKHGRQIEEGRFLYSVMTPMEDGTIGMAYESINSQGLIIKFAKFNMSWLGADCLSEKTTGIAPKLDPKVVAKAEEAAKAALKADAKVQELVDKLGASKANDVMLRQELAAAEADAAKAHAAAEEAKAAVAQAEEAMRAAVEEMQVQLDSMKEQAVKTEGEMAEQTAALEKAQQQLKEAGEKNAELQAKLQEVETQLAESREKAAALAQQAKEQSKVVKDVTEQVVKEVPGDKEDAAVPAEKKGFSWASLIGLLGMGLPILVAIFNAVRQFLHI
ncbi:sialidase [Corynebacterium diphtheriae]|nr:sialidase [Corynebacterium diphtheriae]CAB0892233.1 sialidase [Corynebacterium diphtheriae]CAB0985712.1 sialidase [Corynebacterium diphtheriae]